MNINFIKTMMAAMSINTAFSADINIFDEANKLEANKLNVSQEFAKNQDPEYEALNSLIPSGHAIIITAIAKSIDYTSLTYEEIKVEVTKQAFLELKGSTEFDIELFERFEALESKYKSSSTAGMLAVCHAVWNNPAISQNYRITSEARKNQEEIECQQKLISITEELKETFGAEKTFPYVEEMIRHYPRDYLESNWPAVLISLDS
jgi:hypothetical protein